MFFCAVTAIKIVKTKIITYVQTTIITYVKTMIITYVQRIERTCKIHGASFTSFQSHHSVNCYHGKCVKSLGFHLFWSDISHSPLMAAKLYYSLIKL